MNQDYQKSGCQMSCPHCYLLGCSPTETSAKEAEEIKSFSKWLGFALWIRIAEEQYP